MEGQYLTGASTRAALSRTGRGRGMEETHRTRVLGRHHPRQRTRGLKLHALAPAPRRRPQGPERKLPPTRSPPRPIPYRVLNTARIVSLRTGRRDDHMHHPPVPPHTYRISGNRRLHPQELKVAAPSGGAAGAVLCGGRVRRFDLGGLGRRSKATHSRSSPHFSPLPIKIPSPLCCSQEARKIRGVAQARRSADHVHDGAQ